MFDKWIATKHKTDGFGEWSIAPRDYFKKHGRIPDTKANLNIHGMDEIMDHTLKSLDGSDGVHLLVSAGIEIEHNPIWYFDRHGYVDPDV